MNQYKVDVSIYAPQKHPGWAVQNAVHELIGSSCEEISMQQGSWKFCWITEGGNKRYDVSLLITAPSKVKAKRMALLVTNYHLINQAYVRDVVAVPSMPLYPYWVTLEIRLETFQYNNGGMLYDFLMGSKHYKRRKDRLGAMTLSSIPDSWKRWKIDCFVKAEDQSEAVDLAVGAFNCSILAGAPQVANIAKVSKPSKRVPTTKATQVKINVGSCAGTLQDARAMIRGLGLTFTEKKSKTDIYNFNVSVVVSADRSYVEKRAAKLLNECAYVEDWEILGSEYRRNASETHVHLFIRYRASRLDIAEKAVKDALARESLVKHFTICQDTYYGSMRAQVLMERAAGFTHDQLINTINKLPNFDLEKLAFSRDAVLVLMEMILQGNLGTDKDRDELGKEIASLSPCAAGWVYALKSGQTLRITNVIRIGEDLANISCTMQPDSKFPYEIVFRAYSAFYNYINIAGIEKVVYISEED